MDHLELEIFRSEVLKQAEFALFAAGEVKKITNGEGSYHSYSYLWFYVQAFLVAVANVSKLLWGGGRNTQEISERRKELREALNIEENSTLKSKVFRNYFEHFDEKIESWASSSERKNFVDSNIGPIYFEETLDGFDKDDILRNFNTQDSVITFKGDKFEMKPVIKELEELTGKSETTKN